MQIDSITLQNYRCHADLSVSFGTKFNVLVGVNGSGKTSLLKGVCEALNGLMIGMNVHYMPPFNDAGHVRLLAVKSQGRYRYESQYPVKISAGGEAFETGCVWTWTKPSQVSHAEITGQYPGQVWQGIQRGTGPVAEAKQAAVALPLVSFYRANRHWNQPPPHELQSATQRNSRIDGYANWWDASLDSVALQGWVIGKCLERFQVSSETGAAFDAIDSDELALVNAALAAAVEGVKGLRYDLKQRSLLVEWLDAGGEARDPTAFENLSDGQRAVTGLVADIARRMCLLNPQLGTEVTAKTSGVVLIDELDMHLHPKWQRIVTRGLKTAFPALQFIVASHSPQVLGELRPEEIILLHPHGTSHPQVSYGLDSSRVLEEIMETTERSAEVEKALAELFATLERNELDSARMQLKVLAELAPGIAELGGAQALLKRKEVLGR